jgi:hypothetical protein
MRHQTSIVSDLTKVSLALLELKLLGPNMIKLDPTSFMLFPNELTPTSIFGSNQVA